MEKKKVLFLLEAFDKGGIEQVTLDIVNHLNPNKYDITVQTFWYGGHCQSLVNPNITVKPFLFKRYVKGAIRLIEILSPKMLYRLFVHGDYDVEIAASDGGAAKVISGSTNKKAKKICWVHMDVMDWGSKLKEFADRSSAEQIYSKFDRIICVSGNAEKQFNKKFGFESKTIAVHNPIHVNSIVEKANKTCSTEFSDDCFNIVAVGSLVKVKGFERLIRVCGKLAQSEHLPVRLYIVGSGPMESELSQIISNNRFDNITLLGFCANPYPYIKNANLFVCSSYSESYPTVIGESFALSTPVLATRCSGTCEWMELDKSGMIVGNDEESLYAGIRSVVTDPQIYKELQRKSALKSKELDFEQAMDLWEKNFFQ